jgi:hypothetical protein
MRNRRNPVAFALPPLLAVAMLMPILLSAAEADAAPARPRKFKRVWTFVNLRDEDFARKIAALNVQNVGGCTTPSRRGTPGS